jgi:hypothetical protein
MKIGRLCLASASRAPAVRALALLLATVMFSCVVDAPVAHRSDERASYASKYFSVDAPAGPGWEAVVSTAEHPFVYERALFTPWVSARIGFVLHDWRELWPHSLPPEPTIEFDALPSAASPSEAVPLERAGAVLRGDCELGGMRWRVFEDAGTPTLRSAELVTIDAGILFSVRMRLPPNAHEVPPPELGRVVAGFHRESVTESPGTLTIERGVTALYRTASDSGWSGDGYTEERENTARTGIEVLMRTHPERYEGPLFAAGLELLHGRNERSRMGGIIEPVGPFEVALEHPQGRISTTALSSRYDAASVVRSLRESLSRAPESFWARYHLGIALVRAGNSPAGVRELTALSEQHPESALAWFALALIQRDAGDVSAARESAHRAAAANAKQKVFAAYGSGLFGGTMIDALTKELQR